MQENQQFVLKRLSRLSNQPFWLWKSLIWICAKPYIYSFHMKSCLIKILGNILSLYVSFQTFAMSFPGLFIFIPLILLGRFFISLLSRKPIFSFFTSSFSSVLVFPKCLLLPIPPLPFLQSSSSISFLFLSNQIIQCDHIWNKCVSVLV